MDISESIRVAVRGLAANKMRAILTMLGIIIGVGAVITLLSVGQGVERMVTEQFQSAGTNLLFVLPGNLNSEEGQQGGPGFAESSLTMGDVRAIADPNNVSDVVAVAPELMHFIKVVRGNKEMTTQVSGVTPEYQDVRNFYPVEGNFIGPDDYNGKTRVALLGQTVSKRLFRDDTKPTGQTIKINNVPFLVIGVMEEKGGTGFGDQDNTVLIPLTTMQARLFAGRRTRGEYRVSVIYAQVASEDRMEKAMEEITTLLRQRHNITFRDEDDFTVISQSDIISVFGAIFGTLTIYLGAIAAISLLVGGIGIMNIMLVSVTERTREIGIRKAVGAKRRDILLQFLIEAMVLSLIGGFIGIGLGAAGSQLIAQLANLQTVISPGAVLLATGFSAAVGLFFGIYPATRAARLSPIDALRYE
jgi:putative ABC transport system permease protein